MTLSPIEFWLLVLAIGYASLSPITAFVTIIIAVFNIVSIFREEDKRIRKMPYDKKDKNDGTI